MANIKKISVKQSSGGYVTVPFGADVDKVDIDSNTTLADKVPEWDNKIDPIEGKVLSTNDFTNADKNKLDNVASDAEANVIDEIKVNNETLTVTDKAVNIEIPDASGLAPIEHSSSMGTYGLGDSSNYGHVRVADADSTISDNAAAASASSVNNHVTKYVNSSTGVHGLKYNPVTAGEDPKLQAYNATTQEWEEIPLGGSDFVVVQIPEVVIETYTFTNTVQGPSIVSRDTTHTQVSGDATATAAGNYTFTISLLDSENMLWTDGTTEAKTYSWSIDQAVVSIPTVVGNYTYDTTQKEAQISSFDSNLITQTGTVTSTNAGMFTVTFALKDTTSSKWSDTTITDKDRTWSIAKANQIISVSKNSVTLNSSTLSDTVVVSGAHGTITAVTNPTGIASTTVNGANVVIAHVNQTTGTTTVSIDAAATDNYNASNSVDVSVSAEFKPALVSWSTGTDAEIKAMVDGYYDGTFTLNEIKSVWTVGDTRLVNLNAMTAPSGNSGTWAAQKIAMQIIDFDHTELATSIGGKTKSLITVQTREVLNNASKAYDDTKGCYVNGDSSDDYSFTKWSNLYMRTYLNNTVLNAITYSDGKGSGTSFKDMIKPSKHYRHTTYNGSASEQVTDTLFLPSYPEVFGTASYSYYVATSPVEGTRFAFYIDSSNRVKYWNNNGSSSGVATYWWESSASSEYNSSVGYYWCEVGTNGRASRDYGIQAYGLAPAFAI